MKLLPLDINLSNSDYEAILNIYTKEELENHLKKYIKDLIEVADPKQQERLLKESRAVMQQLKNIKL